VTQLQNQEIEDQRVELGPDDTPYLGPKLELRRCVVVIDAPADALTLNDVRFLDCEIEAKKELSNFYWLDAFLRGCKLTGRYSGCDFGHWVPEFSETGGIESCDFSEASLDGCRFIGCDASTLRFPAWPCFTILDPVRRVDELRSAPWPADTDILVDNIADFPDTTAAVSYDASVLAEEFEVDIDGLKATVERLEGVTF
jgi:hypothetical protein